MVIDNFTGYMLGNTDSVLVSGDQWWPVDTDVFVCLTLNRAREILRQSHMGGNTAQPVWTTIYKVKARNLPCTRIKNGLVYTNSPTQIFVDRIVYYTGEPRVSEQDLLRNAAKLRTDFFKLVNNRHRGK